MRTRIALLTITAAMTLSAEAQRGDLSIGLNALYFPSGFAGIGGSLDYRWRLCGRTELIGLLSQTHFFDVSRREALRGPQNSSPDDIWDRTIQAGGIGFGYRFGKEHRGFHLGLLAGGVGYRGVDMDSETRHLISPAIGLTMGHPIGKHLDVSLDGWLLKTVKDEFIPYPLLRFSYSLSRKK